MELLLGMLLFSMLLGSLLTGGNAYLRFMGSIFNAEQWQMKAEYLRTDLQARIDSSRSYGFLRTIWNRDGEIEVLTLQEEAAVFVTPLNHYPRLATGYYLAVGIDGWGVLDENGDLFRVLHGVVSAATALLLVPVESYGKVVHEEDGAIRWHSYISNEVQPIAHSIPQLEIREITDTLWQLELDEKTSFPLVLPYQKGSHLDALF